MGRKAKIDEGNRLEVVEKDETGNTTAIYIGSKTEANGPQKVDVAPLQSSEPIAKRLLAVFLPTGYPQSVTSDYIDYQIYDSLQAFSSSIASLLASRAVLEGVGVGDANASPTQALLLSIVQEGMGRIATILFAHRLGTALEPECKMYRLAADIFNDSAMVLDCLSPAFPKHLRVAILSLSSVLRALCGVAAGSAKATLSAHFAKWNNLGEVNAKDSSQETVISLAGMLAGSVVVPRVTSARATWIWLFVLLSIHLYTNYLAVRAVRMTMLNRQRANIVFSNLIADNRALTPAEVAAAERVFEADSVIRWKSKQRIGSCRIGVPFSALLSMMRQAGENETSKLLHIFSRQEFLLWTDATSLRSVIVLKQGCSSQSQLKAWLQAVISHHLWAMKQAEGGDKDESSHHLQQLERSLSIADAKFGDFVEQLSGVGWDMSCCGLETRWSYRVSVGSIG